MKYVWLVSREYAGIAEAGGVKNVACSLSENLVSLGNKVTLFIPLYACTELSNVKEFNCLWHKPVKIHVCDKDILVTFSHGICNGVDIVFIGNKSFSEKQAVYTYTKQEAEKNPNHKQGEGHEDAQFLNCLFEKAVIAYGSTCNKEDAPDIIHSQDATAALVPAFMNEYSKNDKEGFYKKTKCVVTIHNAGPGYHHEFSSINEAAYYTDLPNEVLTKGLNGNVVEPFLLSALYSCMTTVSPEYAQEIMDGSTQTAGLSQAFKNNKTYIYGITNGIDIARYDPKNTKVSLLPYSFNPEKKDLKGKYECRDYFINNYASKNIDNNVLEQYGYIEKLNNKEGVLIAYHGRLVHQKGISVLADASNKLLSCMDNVAFAFIGQGQPEMEQLLINVTERYKGKAVYLRGYDRAISRLVMASSDFAIFPSFFEPCGLEDFIAQIYGTLPIAHATGGLKKIVSEETGFLYQNNNSDELFSIIYALCNIYLNSGSNAIFKNMIAYAAKYVRENYSWEKVAQKYEKLYEKEMETC